MNTGFGTTGVIAAPTFGFIVDRGHYLLALSVSGILLVIGLFTVRYIDTSPLRHPECAAS
jgi:NADH:ubiquinone oxidoreductase subunit 5 (subunit L)/multisubunit Na+/H+ antiporter MnhA subunit